MKRVELRPVDERGLMSHEHFPAVFEGIDYNSARVSQPYLEDRPAVLPPPLLAGCSMVLAKPKQMACDWYSSRDLGQAFDVRDVCVSQGLPLP